MDILSYIFQVQSWWDVLYVALDLSIVYFVIYRILLLIKGTRAVQMMIGLVLILLFMVVAYRDPIDLLLGIVALVPVAIYPFAKRFTWWPQIFLGLAFNWGALLAWTAHTGSLGWSAVILYLAGMAWTLFYDTIYAHQDAEDDALIGVKSTARLFGDASPRWLRGFGLCAVALMLLAVASAVRGSDLALVFALCGPLAMAWHLRRQLHRLDLDDHARLLALFRSNRDAGLLPVPFFAAAFLL